MGKRLLIYSILLHVSTISFSSLRNKKIPKFISRNREFKLSVNKRWLPKISDKFLYDIIKTHILLLFNQICCFTFEYCSNVNVNVGERV